MSYADRDGVIWMDGRMVPWREAKVHVLTHTLHYGVGAFEGIRAYKTPQGTALFRLDDHIQRLYNTAHILEMDIPYEFEVIRQACIDAIRENGLETGYVRPLVYYGSEGMGLHADNLSVHVSIAAWVWGAYLGAEALERGIRIKTSSYTRHLVNSIMCRAKACGNYINSIMALQEAARDGYDEALLLDNEGMVAEGSGENIFIVRKGIIYTPDITSALEGITRETGMSLYEVMLSESQERMLMVLRPGAEDIARKIFEKWQLDFAIVGKVSDTGRFIGRAGGENWAPGRRGIRV